VEGGKKTAQTKGLLGGKRVSLVGGGWKKVCTGKIPFSRKKAGGKLKAQGRGALGGGKPKKGGG